MPPILRNEPCITSRVPGSDGLDTDNGIPTELPRVTMRQNMASELQQGEANLLQSMDDLQPYLSPFQRLPYDIVGEILLACMDVYPIMDPGHAPLLFLRISRSIRQVALSQPRIWSGILINTAERNFRLMEFDKENETATATLFIRSLKEWLLVRSGNVPLNIKVQGDLFVSSTDTIGDSILDVLYTCKRRWRALTISLTGPRGNEIPAFNGADFPDLQHFSFSCSGLCTALLTSDFLLAPKLQGLKLHESGRFTGPIPLPWSTLTFIDLATFPTPVFPMLRQATSLAHLSFGYIDSEDVGSEPLNLPFLTSIEFGDRSFEGKTAALLHLLNAPNLTSLTLDNDSPVGDDFVSIVQRFPRLTTLDIDAVDMFSFREVLAHTPKLTTLRFFTSDDICHIFFSNKFLRSFISDDYGPQLCPKLEVFQCGVELEVDEHVLRDFFRKKESSTDGLPAWKFCKIQVPTGKENRKIQRVYNSLVKASKFEYQSRDQDDDF